MGIPFKRSARKAREFFADVRQTFLLLSCSSLFYDYIMRLMNSFVGSSCLVRLKRRSYLLASRYTFPDPNPPPCFPDFCRPCGIAQKFPLVTCQCLWENHMHRSKGRHMDFPVVLSLSDLSLLTVFTFYFLGRSSRNFYLRLGSRSLNTYLESN